MPKTITTACALLLATVGTVVFAQRPMPGRNMRHSSAYILRFVQRAEDALHLEMLTRKRYNHGGYRIELKQSASNNELTITIGGVSTTDGMHTQAFAPARGSFAIPTKKGTYSIKVIDGDKQSILKLVVSPTAVQLSGNANDPLFGKVSLNANILPENVFSVMIVKRTKPSGKDLTAEILADVLSLPGVEKWEPERGPYLCKHWKYPNKFRTYFRMKNELDWSVLEAFAEKYKPQSHMAITIHDPRENRLLKNN